MKYTILSSVLLLLAVTCYSQLKRSKPVMDTLSGLGCPFQKGTMKTPSQEGYGYKGDVKMIITSVTDTLVLSPADGKIDLISMGEGGKYDVVMHQNNYNIWLIGVARVLVKKNDLLKKGQPLGKVNPGDELEFLLFKEEEPVDPKKWLDCRTMR